MVTATAAVILALTLTATIPLWLLALGPIVLGVPHVLGDVRYLVLRRGFHQRRSLVLVAGLPLLVAWWTSSVVVALAAAALAALVARGSIPRRLITATAFASIAAGAWIAGAWGDLAFAHLHNLIGVLLWFLWRPREGALWGVPILAYLAAGALILGGAIDPIVDALGGFDLSFEHLSIWTHSWSLAPTASPKWGLRIVLLFAFAQSIHYWVWLRLIPEDDRGRPTPRTFRRSWRALYRDLGGVLLFLAGVSALGVAIWAAWDVAHARAGYLRSAIVHGQIELVALALFVVEGRPGNLSRAEEARRERSG